MLLDIDSPLLALNARHSRHIQAHSSIRIYVCVRTSHPVASRRYIRGKGTARISVELIRQLR